MFEGEFKLDDKHCDLGVQLGTPTQKHGDDRLPAKVLGFSGVPMGKDEINDFLGDKHAWDMMYIETKGKPAKDFWDGKLAVEIPLAVKKFKNCIVVLKFGVSCEVTFTDCTIKSGKIRRTEGGITLLAFTLVCLKSHIRGDLARLDEFLSQSANVCIEFGDPSDEDDDEESDEEQDELDLDHQAVAGGKVVNGVKQEKVDTSKRRKAPKTTDGATVN